MLLRLLSALGDPGLDRRTRDLLDGEDVLFVDSPAGEDLWTAIARRTFDVLLLGVGGSEQPDLDTIGTVRNLPGRPDIVVFGPLEDAEARARFLAAGCLAVIHTGLPDPALGEALRAMLRRRQEEAQLRLLTPAEESRLGDFVSESPAMRRLMTLARRVLDSDTTLFILGETGVGKEWLARAIHAEGPRGGLPFVAVNCGAIPEGLLESELFGHRAGAFTGALRDHRGFFELAHRGTLFLDEIADLSPHLQVKLLQALQDRAIRRVGAEETVPVDVRVIAATNKDPAREIETGRLREDLYYRLGVVTLTVPPLRERVQDVDALVDNYFQIFRFRLGRSLAGVEPRALAALRAYRWPGNVRELINVVERAVLLSAGPTLTVDDLPPEIAAPHPGARPERGRSDEDPAPPIHLPLREARRESLDRFERGYLEALLRDTGGRIGETARRAGITTRALFGKMKRLGIRKEPFRRETAPRRRASPGPD